MKILGNTPDGDLIIEVSQAEWDGLRKGIKPEEDKWQRWQQSEIYQLLPNAAGYGGLKLQFALWDGRIDGSIQSLRDVVNGKIRVRGIGPDRRARLKKLLDDKQKENKQ